MNLKLSKKIGSRFYYGWMIIFVAALSVFFSAPGQTYSISAFIDSYIDDFGLSRTLVSFIYSVATVISGTMLVFVGRAVDKHGQRAMTVLIGILLAIACFFNSFISSIAMIAVSFFFLRYLGQGSLTLIPGSLTPQWFEKRRAFAISLTNYGGILANILVPILNIYLITTYSWQFAWRVWSILLLVLFVPAAFMFIVNKPEDIGLLPDNVKAKNKDDVRVELEKMKASSWTLNEAMKTKEFWLVGLISMVVPMISTGMVFHFFSIMELKGIDKTSASFVIGLMALPGFIMPVIAALIIDRFRSKYIITFTLLVITLDLIYFLTVQSTFAAVTFMLIYGLAINIQGITISVIWPRYFGRRYLGSIRGVATVFMVIGSALGPLPFGLSYDLTGSYQPVVIAMAVITTISLTMAIAIRKPTKQTTS